MNSFMQVWTCENGGTISIRIPDGATRDDLLAVKEFIDVIIKHRFKFVNEEDNEDA